jgi:ribosomal protein L29
MKRKDFLAEIRGLSQAERAERARSFAEEAMRLRFKGSRAGALADTSSVKRARKSLARVLTVTREAARGE